MRQSIHAKRKMKDHVKTWIVMTVIMLFCFAGCQAKKITGVGETRDPTSTRTGNNEITETGNNGSPASDGMLKLAVVCVEVGGPQKSWIEVLADEYNKNHPDAPVTIVPFEIQSLWKLTRPWRSCLLRLPVMIRRTSFFSKT